MHKKEIKAIVRKQLKREYPNWKRLVKKKKREIADKVLDEVVKGYDFSKEIETPKHELLGIEKQTLNDEIMNLEEMERFIDNHYKSKGRGRNNFLKLALRFRSDLFDLKTKLSQVFYLFRYTNLVS